MIINDGSRPSNKWAVLFTVLVMTFMSCLDSSIVTVALPVMQKELGVGLTQIQWVTSAYLICACVAMLPFGRAGDVRGKVYVFQAGVAVFSLGSLLCGLAPTLPVLVCARVVQGVGCAMAMANNMGIITEAFPEHERGRAMGILATFVALGMMAGPVFGGMLVSVFPWESIFLVNVPVGVASFVVGLKTLPHMRPAAPGEKTVKLPLRVFRDPSFMLNLSTMLITFVGIGASEFCIPFYLQDCHGYAPAVASLIFVTLPVVNAVVGPLSGSASDRVGGEGPTVLGLAVYVCGLLAVGSLPEAASLWRIVASIAAMSLGTSIFQAPNNSLFMGSAPADALGFAGSVGSLARYLGMAVGPMGGSRLLYGAMSAAAGYPVSAYVEGRPDIFLVGFRTVFCVLALLAAVGLLLTVVRLVRSRR